MKKGIKNFLDIERYNILREELKKNGQCSHDFLYVFPLNEETGRYKCRCLECGKFMNIPSDIIKVSDQTLVTDNIPYVDAKRVYNNYKSICLDDDVEESLVGDALVSECHEIVSKRLNRKK